MSQFPKFGPRRLKRLLDFFGSAEAAFKGRLNALTEAGIEEKPANEFIAWRGQTDPDSLLERLSKEGVSVIFLDDERYPRLLKEICWPPVLLYVRGGKELNNDFSLAVVGTRKFTAYGKQATIDIVGKIALKNLSIVSGLALGIDTIAHETCLDAGGHTIAVLGTGIDRSSVYPSSNRYLSDKIVAAGGTIVSEFPLGTQPWPANFPQRNRIIAGLSLGTLVIEAKEKSGALITARYALEQNREVFALPGSIFSEMSKGTNSLIRQGARPVLDADDIFEALDLKEVSQYIDNKKIIPESKEEAALLDRLKREPTHVNELIRLTQLPSSAVIAALALMEMKGMARNVGNMMYVLV